MCLRIGLQAACEVLRVTSLTLRSKSYLRSDHLRRNTMRHLACALLATALATAPALAQSNQPASNADRTNTQANAGQFLTQERPNQWRASKLRGLDVYNNDNEKVGDIREVLLSRDGKAEAVAIGAGGGVGAWIPQPIDYIEI